MKRLGHKCVFASELDEELRALYLQNFPEMHGRIFGDIREAKDKIEQHDFLCAGFPCQPFSKSGAQLGVKDETRGTLFHEILDILEKWRPKYVLLENVGNFGRHDEGRTWKVVRQRLEQLGYFVERTEHLTPVPTKDWRDLGKSVKPTDKAFTVPEEVTTGGHGLISPHHFGFPQHRERFYIYATLEELPKFPFPQTNATNQTSLKEIVQKVSELSPADIEETRLSDQQFRCIEHWNSFIKRLPSSIEPPSFPLWGDELDAKYPFEIKSPWGSTPQELGATFNPPYPKHTRKELMLKELPSYARENVVAFRQWKIRYIQQNRAWWKCVQPYLTKRWSADLRAFPPSLRKLEWNVKGEERDLWAHVLQFRPSGLRVKRFTSSPALVAMTATQIPILGPEKRFLTRKEGLRLQGFNDRHILPTARERAFKALGNAVHVGVVEILVQNLLMHKCNGKR